MNWDAIGAIAEVVGAAAVIITLAYLAIQIRQNTQMNASALRQSFYNYTARQMLHGTDSTEFSELLAKAGTTNETLSPGERLQISRMFHAVFVGYHWKTCRALLRSFWLFKGKEWADLWMQFKTGGFLDDDFVAECELLREEAEHYALALEQKDMGFQRG
jgi:hypothetical protein